MKKENMNKINLDIKNAFLSRKAFQIFKTM